MKNLPKYCISILLLTAFLTPSYSLIVWEGKVVPEWPDQHLTQLGKEAAASGFGFFPRPRDTTYGLTMIVDFSDQVANFTPAQVDEWLNKPGFTMGSTNGSVHDYFYEVSNGKFVFLNDVAGYYRAKFPKSYYEDASGYQKAEELVGEMISYFDSTVNFAKYDNDKSGTTDAISIVYAGSGQTFAQGLWPHAGNIGQTRDSVRLGRYSMSDMRNNLILYVYCHEAGHMVFGWPDLYWFGDYCLMGNRMSDANPVPINDFFRADQGWISTVDITADTNNRYSVWPGDTGYRFVNPFNSSQMYYWTNVKNTGRYARLRGSGILLFRFDNEIRGNTSATSRKLYVVEADGNNDLSSQQWPSPGSAASDFFYATDNSQFSSSTNPASEWGLRIYDITAVADTMQFSVGTGIVPINNPKQMPYTASLSKDHPVSTFDILGRNLRVISFPYIHENIKAASGKYIFKLPEWAVKVHIIR